MRMHAIPRYDLFDVNDDEYGKDRKCYNALVKKLKEIRENTLTAWITKYVNKGDYLALEYYEPNGRKKYICNGRVTMILDDLSIVMVWNNEKGDVENICRDEIIFSNEIHALGYYGDNIDDCAFDILDACKHNEDINGLILRVNGLVKADTDELRLCLQEESDNLSDITKELRKLRDKNASLRYTNNLGYDFSKLKKSFGDIPFIVDTPNKKIKRNLKDVGICFGCDGITFTCK